MVQTVTPSTVVDTPKKPGVVIVSTSLQTQGGISSVVNVHLRSSLTKRYRLYHVPTHRNGNMLIKLYYMIKAYAVFPAILIARDISIVHIHSSMKSSFFRKAYFLVVGKAFGKKVLCHMHSGIVDEFMQTRSTVIRTIMIRLFDHYDLCIAISESWKEILKKYTRTDVVVVYNPVKIPRRYLSKKSRNSIITVLTLGELGERKGTEDLLKIARHLKEYDITFRIGGNGDIGKYESIARALGVDDKVRFLGWVQGVNKEQELKKADIYLLPSYHEGLPMSIIEAMGYGKPVIVTPVGGIGEVIRDRENGFLVDPGDVQKMSYHIKELIQSEKLSRTIGRNAHRTAREIFDSEVVGVRLSKVYEDLLSPERKARNGF